ncbi:MYB transcription factor [Melia azedarach]|uniref:MYB transcription factor n=1 Tax=Melia azedarach TaxID=155640 RepID=A0ACC1XDY3_MELAZ|nr:MYB transcription factor [Melia azedarach]
MASVSSQCSKKEANRGAWTAEEDQKLARFIEIHGPKRWKSVAAKAGVNRCGKSCRLSWMNYLRPNIKRYIRPRRGFDSQASQTPWKQKGNEEGTTSHADDADSSRLFSFVADNNQLFDCYNLQEPLNLEWMSRFFEMDETWFNFS